MKKYFLFTLLCISSIACFSQFDKQVTVRASANFDFGTKGLATNTAGAGLGLDVSFLSKHSFQILVETSADRFWGDKLMLVFENNTEKIKKPTVINVHVGPQYFLCKNIAVSLTYGPSWHTVRNVKYSVDGGFRFALTGFWGANKHVLSKAFIENIPIKNEAIRYFGVGVGYRF